MAVLFFDASKLFGKKSSVKLPDGMVVQLICDNSQKNQLNAKIDGLCFHWSAGTYNQIFDGYAYCITFNPVTGNVWVIKCLNFKQKGYHLWGRNSTKMGISFMACRGASSKWMGQYPVTALMAEAGWELAAELCLDLGINPNQQISIPEMTNNGRSIWATGRTVQVASVADHRAYARLDDYANSRWDIGDFFPNFGGKVSWYHDKKKRGIKARLYEGKLS